MRAAGWLPQRQAATPRRGLACSLWELACQRMFACGDDCSLARFASRLAPTKTSFNASARLGLSPCGSWPASECSPAVMTVCRHDSPAGWLLQRQGARPRQGLACSLWELACQRMFACGDDRSLARFASRLAPTNTAWPGLQARVHCQTDGTVLRTHPHPMPQGSDLFIGDHLARSVRGIPGAPPAQRR